MIERLVLKNFKSHEDSEIAFNPGLTIFLGDVGAGKTSVLEAISLSFFGRYAGNVNQSELIRRGTEKADISLTFSTSSGRYKINRKIYVGKTQRAKLWIFDGNDWDLAVEGATAVSKSVEDLLDVDSSTFLARKKQRKTVSNTKQRNLKLAKNGTQQKMRTSSDRYTIKNHNNEIEMLFTSEGIIIRKITPPIEEYIQLLQP